MIQLKKDQIMISKQTTKKLKNIKQIALYTFLLSKQQIERIYFENIIEIAKAIKWSYNTTNKYLMILKDNGLIKKYNGVYLINY